MTDEAAPAEADVRGASGHRTLPHTADLIVEAWAPTRAACFDEAVRGLVTSFARGLDAPTTSPVPIDLDPDDDAALLASLLDEVIYIVEVLGVVPVDARVQPTEAGGLAGFLDTVPFAAVEVIGSVPKAVTHHELHFEEIEGTWRCRATIDV